MTNDDSEELEEWSRQVRITIRGIDAQAERILGPVSTDWKAGDEEIIVGYKLKTGLWHRLLGLLACCPALEGNLPMARLSARLPSREELRGAIARGWCVPANEHKQMDPELAEAINIEVRGLLEDLISTQRAEAATTQGD